MRSELERESLLTPFISTFLFCLLFDLLNVAATYIAIPVMKNGGGGGRERGNVRENMKESFVKGLHKNKRT